MKYSILILWAALVLFHLVPTTALGDETEVFALIVTNNRSFQRTRPDLQYADDDGARYLRFFRMVAKNQNVSLLTTFDDSTSRLYPELRYQVKRPVKAVLSTEIRRLERQVAAAKAAGKKSAFYFVFAGHGHVDRGKGFLELEDGRLGPDDLERLILDRIEADTVHVVLDSCNSFFVINPRKPGGKRWATPKDMTEGFSKRYPHVGVVLSTNSAAEVYEWSMLSSGIFSHEIRSGMSGAADINTDGQVSYDEIDAFVATANLGITNETYLPKVYIRGPFNNGNTSFLDLRKATGRALGLGTTQRRIWIRDRSGIRLADLRKETGATLRLVLPVADSESLYIQEETFDSNNRMVLREYVAKPTSTSEVSLAQIESTPLNVAIRGHDEVFQMIFAYPFGPMAFQRHLSNRKKDTEVVFGISEADKLRMGHYLGSLARSDRQKRLIWGGLSTAEGAVLGLAGALTLTENERGLDEYLFGGISVATSVLFLGVGAYQLFSTSQGEKTYQLFMDEVGEQPRSRADSVVAKTELRLEKMRQREKKRRIVLASMLYFVGTASIGAGIFVNAYDGLATEDRESRGSITVLTCTSGLISIALGVAMHFIDTPVERMLRLYREDPDLSIALAITPTEQGGAAYLRGTF